MKKKYRIFGIVFVAILIICGVSLCKELFYSQYNAYGVSKYPCITIDENKQEEYVCENSGYKVYTCKLSEIYFVTKSAETITLKEALHSNKLTVEEMIKVCKKGDGQKTTYIGENYTINILDDKCVIQPKG